MKRVQGEFRTVWLSDVHLGTKACRVEPLLEFLSSMSCEHLFLVGDIIDVEALKRKWYWPASHDQALRLFFARARSGARVTYIPGNHDSIFRAHAGTRFGGIEIHRQSTHETVDGRKVLMLHGDEFDAVVNDQPVITAIGDWFYEWLLAMGRSYDGMRRKLRLPYFSPAAWAKQRVKYIVNFVSNYYQELAEYARRHQADVVVTGHIHRPEIKPMDELTYANCGDWVENCSALVEHLDGQLEVLHIGRDGVQIPEVRRLEPVGV
jgi:UDP-2,3-diacylglucosamine pyrophosphatase LpxH